MSETENDSVGTGKVSGKGIPKNAGPCPYELEVSLNIIHYRFCNWLYS